MANATFGSVELWKGFSLEGFQMTTSLFIWMWVLQIAGAVWYLDQKKFGRATIGFVLGTLSAFLALVTATR